MTTKSLTAILLFGITMLLVSSCKKGPELIDDNTPPDVNNVSRVQIENYLNRMFIDLVGREPLNTEMDSLVSFLKNDSLSFEARVAIIESLQTDTTYRPGDSSYAYAYYHKFYERCKIRLVEGVDDEEFERLLGLAERTILIDSLNGDTLSNSVSSGFAQITIEKLEAVLRIESEYMHDSITVSDIFFRLANNAVYDEINMNTFNFINATFDNLFFRFPTSVEYDAAWEMIENNQSMNLFGQSGQNKGDYLTILTTSREFHEGLIGWAYLQLLARTPTANEVSGHMSTFYYDRNFLHLQRDIMLTNEYANF